MCYPSNDFSSPEVQSINYVSSMNTKQQQQQAKQDILQEDMTGYNILHIEKIRMNLLE